MGAMSRIRSVATNVTSACKDAVEATRTAAVSASQAINRAVDASASHLSVMFAGAASAAAVAYDGVRRAAAAATRKVVDFMKRLFSSKAMRWLPFVAVAVLVVAAVVAVGFFPWWCFSAGAAAGAMMMPAPGAGGLMILRWAFQAYPGLYFGMLRAFGPAVAASFFGSAPFIAISVCIICALFCGLMFAAL